MSGYIKKLIITGLVVLVVALVYRFAVFGFVIGSINNMGEQFIENSQQARQKLQEQQHQRTLQQQQAARAKAEAQLRAQQVARRRQEQQLRYEQAFTAWYQEPEGCDNWRSDTHMVECVNHKMRAKGEFATLYKTAQL
jgi:uncharacterized protein HemX